MTSHEFVVAEIGKRAEPFLMLCGATMRYSQAGFCFILAMRRGEHVLHSRVAFAEPEQCLDNIKAALQAMLEVPVSPQADNELPSSMLF